MVDILDQPFSAHMSEISVIIGKVAGNFHYSQNICAGQILPLGRSDITFVQVRNKGKHIDY